MKFLRDITMERPPITGKYRFWFVVSAAFLFWYLLLCFCNSELTAAGKNSVTLLLLANNFGNSINNQEPNFVLFPRPSISERIKEFPEKVYQNISDEETRDINNASRNESPTVLKAENLDNPRKDFRVEDDGFEAVNQISVSGEGKMESDNYEALNEFTSGTKQESSVGQSHEDSCSERYIYIHDLPTRFNQDLLNNCRLLSNWTNMCEFTSNYGLGPLQNSQKVFSKRGWYTTNQFSLEVIFHNRMKQYDCLTNNSSLASAVYVPYYAGLDVARYLWGHNTSMRDSDSFRLTKWLREKPEWRKMSGRDHFLVAGRITWDFRRLTDEESDWGNKFLFLPESKNMTVLTIESSPWHNNDFGIPYPTYFHPQTDAEVLQWQNRMRKQRRRFLFSFAGAPRPNLRDSIRNEIIDQCRASRKKCKLLECNSKSNNCNKPDFVMKMFHSSVFCLQPPGDSSTRRSAFDSILAGCIPVFFHPGSAYLQYLWHLPKNFTEYSVFISGFDVKSGRVSVEKILLRIPKQRVAEMRERVIRLIPKVIYAGSKLENLDDAFDISIKGVLDRVRRITRQMKEGKDSGLDYPEELSWKYNFFGTVGEHEWDRFFART